jgi:hypothetical protein
MSATKKFNRDLQLEILRIHDSAYPSAPDPDRELKNLQEQVGEEVFLINRRYLSGHGLLEGVQASFQDSPTHTRTFAGATKITSRGLDLLAGDGGLSAILHAGTVRLDDDTIRRLLERHVDTSEMSPQERSRWREALRSLPSEALKALTAKLVENALDSAGPAALHVIRGFLGI